MANLAEHQAPEYQDTQPAQNEDNEDTVKMVKRLLERSKQGTMKFRAQWPTNYQFVFSGRQWPIERPEWRFSEVENLLWADVMTEVGIQTDSRPKTDFVPMEPSDIPFCEILKEINDYNWQKYSWINKVAENVLDTKIFHASFAEISWNPDLEHGLGDVDYVILDPYGCYPDPAKCGMYDSRVFQYVQPVPTAELKAKCEKRLAYMPEGPEKDTYQMKIDKIRSDIEFIGAQVSGHRVSTDVDRVGFDLTSGNRGRRPNPDNHRFGQEPMTLLIRTWLYDTELEQVANESVDASGEKKTEYVMQKKYPQGRYIEVANNQVFLDGAIGVEIDGKIVPYKDGKIPIVRFVNYSYPREMYGENEVSHRMGPQIVTNYIYSFMLDSMKMASNPKEIFSAANVEASELSTNEPGQALVLPDFNGYRREAGEGIPPNLDNLLEASLKMSDKIGGLPDIMRGAVDPSVGSSLLFNGYVEAAQVRPRLKNRSLDRSLQELGQLQASRYLQFYTAPRTYRLTNKEGWPEFVTFFVSEDENGMTANVSRQTLNANGNYIPGPTQQIPVKGVPDIQVASGSSIPFAKAQKFEEAKQLFQMQAIDQKALLEDIDYPKRDEVIDRMAQVAQQAAASQPPSGGK